MSTKRYTYELYAKDGLSGELKKIKSISNGTYKKLVGGQQQYNSQLSAGSGLVRKLGGLISVYFGAQTLTSIVKLGANMEQTRVAFSTFLGSAEKANTVIKNLNEFSNITPFNNEEVIKSGRVLLAAQIPAEKLTERLKAVGDIAAGANVPLTEMSAIYAKAMNKGRVQAEELNQLAERGVPILQEFAKMYGISTEKVMEMGSKGQLTSSQLTLAFQRMTGEGGMFYNMMEKQSATLGGKWSTLVGKIQLLGATAGESSTGVLNKIVDKLIQMADYVSDNFNKISVIFSGLVKSLMGFYNWIKRNAEMIGFFTVTLLGALAAYKAIMIVTKAWTAIQWLLNAAMSANPLGLIIIGITALITAVVYAWYKFDKFRGFLFGLWEAFKEVFLGIKDLAVGVFEGLGKLILGAITFSPSKIGEGISQLGGSFSNYGSQIAAKFTAGFDEGVAFKPQVPDFIKKLTAGTGAGTTGEGAGAAGTGGLGNINTDLGTDGNVQAGINGITSGGSKPTTINITLGKFQDQLVIHAANLQEGIDEMEDKITESLLRVLNSANKIATQ